MHRKQKKCKMILIFFFAFIKNVKAKTKKSCGKGRGVLHNKCSTDSNTYPKKKKNGKTKTKPKKNCGNPWVEGGEWEYNKIPTPPPPKKTHSKKKNKNKLTLINNIFPRIFVLLWDLSALALLRPRPLF